MASVLHSPLRFYFLAKNGKKTKTSSGIIFARFSLGDDDAIFRAAVSAASIRFQESLRPDPLFIDPYAGCLLSYVPRQEDIKEQCPTAASVATPCNYSLTTKFIDDKLLSLMNSSDELRQIMLLTDGMDTRPYRLNWPRSSVIYDICPGRVFKEASQRLQGAGAKISKACVLLHVPLESSDIHGTLCRKGFRGNKPSLWMLQGFPLTTLTHFEDLLGTIGSLAMEGSIFIGELPGLLLELESENMSAKRELLEKLFMSYGFQVDVIECDEIARNLHLDPPLRDNGSIVFFARQLRLSDAEMEVWRQYFGRLEEDGDEDGFEEL